MLCCRSHWAFNFGAKELRKCLPHLIISAHITIIHLHYHHGGLYYSFIHVHSLISVSYISPHTVSPPCLWLFSILLFSALNLILLCMQYHMSIVYCWPVILFAFSVYVRWEDNIKVDLQKVGGGCGNCMELAQDRERWQALVSTVMNFRVP